MEITREEIRRLVDRPVSQHRVTSVYLSTDGARYPRAADYESRLDGLLRSARQQVEGLGGAAREGVERDCDAIKRWVRNDFDRSGVKGLALFASNGELIETVQEALPFRNIAKVNDSAYVVPLEVQLGRAQHIGLVFVERNRARIFRYHLGRILSQQALESDVHGQHAQGGWSQRRFQQNIEHEKLHHFKDAAEALRREHEQEAFQAVVLAGPHEEVLDFRGHLHPYLDKLVHGEDVALQQPFSTNDLLEVLGHVEQELVSARRKELLERLAAGEGQQEHVARGIRHVVQAVNEQRVEVLFVVEGAGLPGFRSTTGALALHEEEAAAFGGHVEPVDDLIDEVIDKVVRAGSSIELFREERRLDGHPVAALLRF